MRKLHDRPQLESDIILGFTIGGTAPIFYKIPVNQELVDAIATGRYPKTLTIVEKLVPPVPNMSTYKEEGMKPLGNRRIIAQCLQALKELVSRIG